MAALRRRRPRLCCDLGRGRAGVHANRSRCRPRAARPRQRRHPGGHRSCLVGATLAVAASGATSGTAPKAQKLPTVQGGTQVGQVLTAQVGTWTGSPTSYSYQWRRCATGATACVAIAGAGGITYTISPGDIGSVISLTVTAIGKGGAGSATAKPTATILAAPVPAPAVENTIAQAGQAGAVTTVTGVATATWQPGALPNQAAVGLVDATSHLSLKGTSVRLSFGAVAPLPWPIDVQYPAAPADAVPGILPLQGVWQPLAELPTPILPPAQQAGTYRDAAGTLHLLTRTAGRIALFAAGKWGDPRYATALKPRVALVNNVTKTKNADGSIVVYGRITLDTQAHLYVTLAAANGRKLLLTQKGSRVGWWLQGKPAKTLAGAAAAAGCAPVPAPRPRRAAPRQGPAHAADRRGRSLRPEVDAGRQARLTPPSRVFVGVPGAT